MEKRFALMLVLSFVALAVLQGCGGETGGGGDGGGDGGGSAASGGGSNGGGEKAKSDCGFEASDDCTPHVGPNGKVRVDALVWRVRGVEAAQTIGDQTYGLGQKADGTFLIVKLRVTSRKDESATLSDESIQLDAGGTTYKADNEGTIAAVGAGEEPLFLEDIGPDSTLNSEVVFDVPKRVLNRKLELRFNELGIGETHGFIRLASPTAR